MGPFEGSYQGYPPHDQDSPTMPVYIEGQYSQNYAIAQQHASMLAMSGSTARATETKPRLAKEDVAFLERAFDNNHKPTTQTKRGYAESMGVDLPRINNWFQNRRAKQKNLRKQEEFRNSQCQDGRAQSEPSSPDEEDGHNFFGDDIVPLQHSATFPLINGPPPAVAPFNPQYANPASASMESLQRTLAVAQAAQQSGPPQFNHTIFEHDSTHIAFAGVPQDLSGNDHAQFPAPETVDTFKNQHYSFATPIDSSYHSTASFPEPQQTIQETYENTPKGFLTSYTSETLSQASQLTPSFPSQLLSPNRMSQPAGVDAQDAEDLEEFVTTPGIRYEIQSPEESMIAPPPPPSSALLKAPPSADIASRRPKVHNKPAALGLNFNLGRPQMGPRTVSHAADGFRRPSDSPLASPMRRIVSAGGNRTGMPGRIQKPGADCVQRSPINLGGFSDAGAFMERNMHNIRNNSILGPSPTNLAPPTPLSPKDGMMGYIHPEAPSSAASPVDGPNYVYTDGSFTAASVHQHGDLIKSQNGDQSLTSPPVTPENAFGLNISSSYEWDNPDFHGAGFYDVPDAPIFTPAQETFKLEIQMPQPAYIHSLSQPVTPAVYQYPPNVFLSQDHSPLEGEPDLYSHSYPNQQEYTFPGSQPPLFISPTIKHKTFQFSNSTPADFSEK